MYVGPIKRWRLDVSKSLDKDFRQLANLIRTRPDPFPVLEEFRCFVARVPAILYLYPPPANIPFVPTRIAGVSIELEKRCGFVLVDVGDAPELLQSSFNIKIHT